MLLRSRRWRRKLLVSGAVGGGLMLMLGAAAWACTQRVGTLMACRPASRTFVQDGSCARITGTTQTGSPTIDDAALGARFSVKATKFRETKYNVTFTPPAAVAAGESCHRSSSNIKVLTSTTGKKEFFGPKFYAEFELTSAANYGPSPGFAPGPFKICSQDMPDVVIGQVINGFIT